MFPNFKWLDFRSPLFGRKEVGCQIVGFQISTVWSKRAWVPNGLVFECHLNYGQPNHLNSGQMDTILFFYVLVWYTNGWSST